MAQSRSSSIAIVCATVVGTLLAERLWNLFRTNAYFTTSSARRGWAVKNKRSVKPQYSRRHIKSLTSDVPIIVTEQVDEYRAAVEKVVRKSDRCLEVGCHNATTTMIISRFAQYVVGIDKSTKQLSTGWTKLKGSPDIRNCELVEADAFDVQQVMSLGPFEVVFIDISGSRELKTLLPLIESYEKVLKPRLFVVKSYKLCNLYERLHFLGEFLVGP